MKFLRKNWLKIILIAVIVWTACFVYLDSKIAEKQYKENIENLDIDVQRLRSVNKSIRSVNDALRKARAKEKAAADKKIAELEENQKRELVRIGTERDEWKAKVKDMPPSVIVVEIRTILKTDEIWERPDGILFSLVAAKDCLAILGDFSIAEERDQWREDYFKVMGVIKDKDNIIAISDEIIIGIDDINFNLEKIIEKKDEKFKLSEGRNRQMYWKGARTGGIAGGILGFVLGLILNK